MREETEFEVRERKMQEELCGLVGHEFEDLEMPYEWEYLNTSLTCKYCTFSQSIQVARVKATHKD